MSGRAPMDVTAHVPLSILAEDLSVDPACALDETLKSMLNQGIVRLSQVQVRKAGIVTLIFTSRPTTEQEP